MPPDTLLGAALRSVHTEELSKIYKRNLLGWLETRLAQII